MMNAQEKKQYLNSYRLQQARIDRLHEMIQRFPKEKERYEKQLLLARMRRNRIEEEIEAIGDDILRELLSQRFLCGKTMQETALCLHYSMRQAERLLARALGQFEVLP